MKWLLSSSSDPRALALADRHYSRRTPGSKTFTGVGREIVLVSDCGRAVWAVVYQKVPAPAGSGQSRGRQGETAACRFVWRNMMFRNEGAGLSSELIRSALIETRIRWVERYGALPSERLRTEVDCRKVLSPNPGYCYLAAGWTHDRYVRGKRYLLAPLENSCAK